MADTDIKEIEKEFEQLQEDWVKLVVDYARLADAGKKAMKGYWEPLKKEVKRIFPNEKI